MKTKSRNSVKLKIADVVIQMHSRFAIERIVSVRSRGPEIKRYNNFFYTGRQNPHILIEVEIVSKLPKIINAKQLFITYHFQDGKENWRLLKKDKNYIYKTTVKDKNQVALMNKTFDRATVYLLPKKGDQRQTWMTTDIIYDFLQVLLISYFSQRNQAIFTHAVGIRNLDGRGLLFTGKSGCGKSTAARIWHRHSRAMVLNDDRVIVRKIKNNFFIYGSPWHGDFDDYLASRIESAPLARLFFIHHSSKNIVRPVSGKKAFQLLYPAIFPTFWDKKNLENIVSFCHDLIKAVPCFSLGFVNDKRIIGFVRKIDANSC